MHNQVFDIHVQSEAGRGECTDVKDGTQRLLSCNSSGILQAANAAVTEWC